MARPVTIRPGPRRAVLLLAVILGILAMHHVATVMPHAPAAHAAVVMDDHPTGPTGDDSSHDSVQHLLAACLAVLTAGVALLLLLIAIGVVADSGTRRAPARPTTVRFDRGPPFARPTSRRLAELCLLRV